MLDMSTLYHVVAVSRTRAAASARWPQSELYNELEWLVRTTKKRVLEFGKIIAALFPAYVTSRLRLLSSVAHGFVSAPIASFVIERGLQPSRCRGPVSLVSFGRIAAPQQFNPHRSKLENPKGSTSSWQGRHRRWTLEKARSIRFD